jgi:PHD/YefM family antitoxin component YafN of YafNO toxin-antitoxin module
MSITHQTVIGEDGQPQAAIIPWSVFLEIQSLVDDGRATPEEVEAIREAEADRKAGNMDAFTDLEDLKAELSL